MPIVLHFRTFGHGEAKTRKDVNDFVLHDGEGVACTHTNGIRSARQINAAMVFLLHGQGLFQLVQLVLHSRLEFVNTHSHFSLLLGRNVAEVVHQFVERSLFAHIAKAKFLPLFFVAGFQGLNFRKQGLDFLYHIIIIYRSVYKRRKGKDLFVKSLPLSPKSRIFADKCA